MLGMSYNKEYREGFPREFLLTAAVGIDRTRRVRSIPTAKVCKNSHATIPKAFLGCKNMSRNV